MAENMAAAEERTLRSGHRTVTPLGVSLGTIAGSVLLLLIFFHATTPLGAGPLGILTVFVLLYALFVGLFFASLTIVSLVIARIRSQRRHDTRRTYYIASVLGFVPVLYLTLASMGGVSFWGVSLIFVFVGLSLFYVLRRL